MAHHCHATGCPIPVSPTLFMCRTHWFKVPRPIRERILETYRPGQCDDMNPSREYCEAARAAVIVLAAIEGRRPDTRLYDLFLAAR